MIDLDYSNQIGKKILIPEKSKTTCVDVVDITHISCDDYVCTVYLVNKEEGISTVRSLNDMEEELKKYGGFTRIHRNTLMNDKYFHGSWTVKGKKYFKVHNTEIVVSRRKWVLFK